ncbi:LHFPL tetraspan subfamily member 3 protein [Fragariocoptes setiger]|uniref:LHFPL tetraspan subfamily member 3 protein n=1 Tax=Fragariocoptes setiger TaxID=1670756 RepID=A0ABQ7SD18_9ACAR|nr:LHFPL tetraspan subfamily member 3 protein [Fragariocoptes setiger]
MDPTKSLSLAAMQGVDPTLTDLNYLNLQTNFEKSKSIGVLWSVFTMSFAIINVIVFVQPQWLGDTELSRGTGYFGLWKSCRLLQDGQDLLCQGKLNDLSSIPTPAFKFATVLVGISVLLIMLCILAMLLFFFMHSSTVFHICGWLQFGCRVLIFPAGWDSSAVKEVCGSEAGSYNSGQCSIRWAHILAIIGVVDCAVLSILAFVLGTRYAKLLPDQYINLSPNAGSVLGKGEINPTFMADNFNRKSMTLQPIMMMQGQMPVHMDSERYSEYGARSIKSGNQY